MTHDIQIHPMRARVMQIIVFALIAGVVAFTVVALFQSLGKPAGDPFMAYFAAITAVLMIVVRFTVPQFVAVAQGRQMISALSVEDEDRPVIVEAFTNTYQMKIILENAFLEGAAFFNLIAYILAAQTWTLAVVGALVAIMILSFPTVGKVESWVREQIDAKALEQ